MKKRRVKVRKQARSSGREKDRHQRGPSDKSKDSKVKKLIRLAKSGGRPSVRAQNPRAQTQLKRR